MRRRPFPLYKPKTPCRADDPRVPYAGCGCDTCKHVRDAREGDVEEAHWQRVGELVGINKVEKV